MRCSHVSKFGGRTCELVRWREEEGWWLSSHSMWDILVHFELQRAEHELKQIITSQAQAHILYGCTLIRAWANHFSSELNLNNSKLNSARLHFAALGSPPSNTTPISLKSHRLSTHNTSSLPPSKLALQTGCFVAEFFRCRQTQLLSWFFNHITFDKILRIPSIRVGLGIG